MIAALDERGVVAHLMIRGSKELNKAKRSSGHSREMLLSGDRRSLAAALQQAPHLPDLDYLAGGSPDEDSYTRSVQGWLTNLVGEATQ